MDDFLQTLITALAVGSLYALIALGYTMVYGILKFINFAHGDIFVLGAWVSFAGAIAVGWGAPSGWLPAGVGPGEVAWAGSLPGWVPLEGFFGIVPPWVSATLAGICILSPVALGYERWGRPMMAARARVRPPALPHWSFFAIAGGWGWAIVVLLHVARGLKGPPAGVSGSGLPPTGDILAGGVLLLVAMLTCGLLGFLLERIAYKPLRKAPRLNVLITAIGVSLFLQNIGQLEWMFGTRPQPMPTLLPDAVLAEIGGSAEVRDASGALVSPARPPVRIRLLDVLGAGTAVLLMVALDRLVFATKLGRAMRATSFNAGNAALMGIPVDRVISTTFVIGTMLAAAAGFLWGQKYSGLNQTAHAGWVLLGLKAFVAAVVGGIGNIRGAMLGGLLIGLLEFFGATYISTDLRDVYVFALLIVVLLVRPSGILGSTVKEKV